VEDLLADLPDLTADEVQACLAFAADRERLATAARIAKSPRRNFDQLV